jgi:hypothetical protein
VRAQHSRFAGRNGGEANELHCELGHPSPAAVSRKRESFKYLPETISDFAPTGADFGARRRIADSQKPAIGGHFSAH